MRFFYFICGTFQVPKHTDTTPMRKLKSLIVTILILVPFLVSDGQQQTYSTKSQKAIGLFQGALKLYNARQEEKALLELQKSLAEDAQFVEALQLSAEIYNTLRDFEKEIDAYLKLVSIDPDKNPKVYIFLGDAESNLGRYKDARTHYTKAALMKGLDTKTRSNLKTLIFKTDFAIKSMENPAQFNLVNLGDAVNTTLDEYWPSLTADEKMLIFTREIAAETPDVMGHAKGQEDLFFSTKDEKGNWTKSVTMGDNINTQKNEGSQTISVDGRLLIFTSCKRTDAIGHCDLYFSERDSSGWRTPVNMAKPVNSVAWEAQPCLSSDGVTLFFVSNRPGGKGGMDIWKSVLSESGTWGEPVNLGDSINTPGDEMSPFMHPDNNTLYFSSNGHIGMGGQDIFMARRSGDGWHRPINLGYPINTFNDESGLIVNARGNLALFASDRNPKKCRDLFAFALDKEFRPVVVSYVKGVVKDSDSNQEIRADFELSDLETSEIVAKTSSVKGTGEYLMCLPTDRDYGLNISKKGYLFHSENFSLKNAGDSLEPINVDISLQTIKVGRKEVLRNVFFNVDSYELSHQSKAELRNLIKFLNQNPEVVIEIGGHTDITGNEAHNDSLSESRARVVYQHLIDNGIGKERLSYKGYSSTMPVTTNDSDTGRALNRRTEFKVIDIKDK